METLQTGFCFSYINIQLWIQLATEMIARRRSNSRSHEERINCPAKQLRLTWHVVCLLSAELPAQTFQFPFPLARLGNERPWQARGRCGVHTFLSLPSFPHTKKHGELDPCIFFQQPHSSKGMFAFNLKGLLLQWKAMLFPLWEEFLFLTLSVFLHSELLIHISCCWVHNSLTHGRLA